MMALAVTGPAFGLHSYTSHHTTPHRSVKTRRSRKVRWNPMFRPSHESLLLQNAEIDRLDLPRIQDDDELDALKESQALVPIRTGQTLRIDPRLDPNRRYCRPWTRDFMEGETASSHLAGLTVDLQRRGMTKAQVHFVERYLFYLRALGLVEPEEERRQWVFHVMVSERYAAWRNTQDVVHWDFEPDSVEVSQK